MKRTDSFTGEPGTENFYSPAPGAPDINVYQGYASVPAPVYQKRPELLQRRSFSEKSSYRNASNLVPVNIPKDDSAILELLYTNVFAPRGVSKKSFYNDSVWQNAELQNAKERISRLIMRGLSADEAVNIYFGKASIRLNTVSKASYAPAKQDDTAYDIEAVRRKLQEVEDELIQRKTNLKYTEGKEEEELREYIHSLQIEADSLRLLLSRLLGEEMDKTEAVPYQTAIIDETPAAAPEPQPAPQTVVQQTVVEPQPAPVAAPVQQPVIIPTPVYVPVRAAAPDKKYGAYVSRNDLMAELQALLLIVNEIDKEIAASDTKIVKSSLRRDKIQKDIADMENQLLASNTYEEMESYSRRIEKSGSNLNSMLLDIEIMKEEKLSMSRDNYQARVRINEIIELLGLSYSEVIRIENEILGTEGVMRSGGDSAGSVLKAKEWTEKYEAEGRERMLEDRVLFEQRQRSIEEQRQLNDNALASNKSVERELAEMRKEFLDKLQQMENDRVRMIQELMKRDASQGAQPRQYKDFPDDMVMVRKADGSFVLKKRSEIKGRLVPIPKTELSKKAPERSKTLPDGTVVLPDGTIIKPDGRKFRPKKPKTEQDVLLRLRVMELRKKRDEERLEEERAQEEQEAVIETPAEPEAQPAENFAPPRDIPTDAPAADAAEPVPEQAKEDVKENGGKDEGVLGEAIKKIEDAIKE